MTVGFIVLAHERLDRVATLVRHLRQEGAEAVVHLDRRVQPVGLDGNEVLQTRASDWGRFALVEAALDAAAKLLAKPNVTHIALISGSCLPVRPIAGLIDHLAAHPGRDFIESVDISTDPWVEDGLSEERFTLWHPFSHRHRPKLFSASVDFQRALRVRRRLPEGLRPHLGSQWWVLSAATLRAILQDHRLPAWRRFFRWAWIPDESFFQTLVRAVAEQPPLPSLHFNRFDRRGKPYVFHDDHAGLLGQCGSFLARKIDPDADGLYKCFLGEGTPPHHSSCNMKDIEDARARELSDGRGQLSAARFPMETRAAMVETAAPYLVVVADDSGLLQRLEQALKGIPGVALHGEVFASQSVKFAGAATFLNGNLPDNPMIRNYRPAQFLQRMVWAEQSGKMAFFYRPTRPAPEAGQIMVDGNARLLLIGDGARLIAMLRRPIPTKRRLWLRDPRPHPVWAWHRVIDPTDLTTDQGIQNLREILSSDWQDPQGWTVPSQQKAVA